MGYVQENQKQKKSCGDNNACRTVCILRCDTVIAAAQEASLVSATIITDKEIYDEGENVNIALTVKNGNIYEINKVSSEIGLPDELTLKSGKLTDGEYALSAGGEQDKRNNRLHRKDGETR